MTLQNSAWALLTRIGEAIAVRFAAKAVQQDGSRVATSAQLAATVDPWIPEEQWLAGFPASRREHFGRLWWQDS
jgi:hypothetical protein